MRPSDPHLSGLKTEKFGDRAQSSEPEPDRHQWTLNQNPCLLWTRSIRQLSSQLRPDRHRRQEDGSDRPSFPSGQNPAEAVLPAQPGPVCGGPRSPVLQRTGEPAAPETPIRARFYLIIIISLNSNHLLLVRFRQKRRGVELGPKVIRDAGLIERLSTLGKEGVRDGNSRYRRLM